MIVRVYMKGTTPLLMHNPQMVDPMFEINREIKALTGKRKKTDDDLRQIEKLEWYGGLYLEENGDGRSHLVQPTSKPRKAIVEAGKTCKLGKSVERALTFDHVYERLQYDGPDDVDELWKAGTRYVSRLSVGIGNKRVMRVRPKFFPWAMTADALFLEDVLNFEELVRLAELAGRGIGIGDNRVNGYGRFECRVEEVG
jgi:hypothetical protein